MDFIDLKAQYLRVENRILHRMRKVLADGQYIMGPDVFELEAVLAEFVGVKHAISCSSGTDALLLALMAIGIQPGDEIITTPFSFYATAEVIFLLGATPVFVDIDPLTYNLDVHLVEQAICSKTKAIMPVSLYGQCADYTSINQIAAQYHLPVIEDGAQSFGATHHGQRSCGLTTIGCTSFFPSKPLGCYGDGGACFTDDDELAERMRCIRIHGQKERYCHVGPGLNARMDTLQAAILLEKFRIFPDEINLRESVAQYYNQRLKEVCRIPYVLSENKSVYAQYTIEINERQAFCDSLKAAGIPTAIHYPRPLHQQPFLIQMKKWDAFPYAEEAANRVVSLPFHPYLTEQKIDYICKEVISCLISQSV